MRESIRPVQALRELLLDTQIESPVSGQILKYDGGKWVNADGVEADIEELSLLLAAHIANLSNPHQTTAHQVGTYTSSEIDAKLTYTHIQSVPSATWTITHNMNRYPAVVVVDAIGDDYYADVRYLSANQLRITCGGAMSGKAYLT